MPDLIPIKELSKRESDKFLKLVKSTIAKEETLKAAIAKAEKNGWKWYGEFDKGVIFSHNFAKAFWGEELVAYCKTKVGGCEASWIELYKFHLQQMVLYPDPIQYLKKFL